MRFKEFKVYLREAKENIIVIGDSIATGIARAGGVSTSYTNPGKNTKFVLDNLVRACVTSGDAKGATVILSSGAANSSKVTTVDGKPIQSEMFGPIANQIKMLKDAGASVALVGVASSKTPPQKPTQYTSGKQWTIDYTGVNSKLEAIASATGAKFLGPLEEFDPAINKGDGIHPYNGYSKLFSEGSSIAPVKPKADDKGQGGSNTKADKPEEGQATLTTLGVPNGRVGPEVADIQKILIALGYSLPKHGVDGVRGGETSSAVKEFQKDYGLEVDGDPGSNTVAKMNALLKSNPKLAGKITKSTTKDVKGDAAGSFRNMEDDEVKKLDALPDSKDSKAARASAEKYLGREMSDDEWNYLIRATGAESSYNTEEYAMVMGSMLNRARDYGKNGVIAALTAKNQFQAVTGTAADGHKPSANFVRGPSDKQMRAILYAAINILPKVSHQQRNFTAANPAAYGAGTNIGYLHAMNKAGGTRVGGTVFNTSLA